MAYWEKTKKYILKIYCEFGLIYKKDGVRCQNTYYSYIFNNLGQIYSRPNLQKNTKKELLYILPKNRLKLHNLFLKNSLKTFSECQIGIYALVKYI